MWQPRLRTLAVPALLAMTLAACSAAPPGTVDRADAVRSVLAEDERFTGLIELDPGLIGQSSWYETSSIADGWRVVVRIGWGDCESGCIHEHRWTYEVTGGAPRLLRETGDALPPAPGIVGLATSGPTCPVVRDPPEPGCDDRPVSGALILIRDAGGGVVARVESGADGRFAIELAPGVYRLEPQPVEGLLGTAAALDVRVEAGQPAPEIVLAYDTGIR